MRPRVPRQLKRNRWSERGRGSLLFSHCWNSHVQLHDLRPNELIQRCLYPRQEPGKQATIMIHY
jgi:hypothetical protein